MRPFVSLLVLFLASATLLAQDPKPTKCELQELAVEAALEDPEAQFDLGVVFFRGELVPQDYSKAAKMWRLASNAGIVKAYNNLGYLTYYGQGVKQDYAEGIRWWRQAAEKGFAESQVHLAEAYSDGKYLTLDFTEAYAWARTGQHYAALEKNEALRGPVLKMAGEVVEELRPNLSAAQLAAAEAKARLYISRYAPPQ